VTGAELLARVQLSDEELSLVDAAQAVSERAYAPYSRYSVGAAVLAENGAVYSGCNVENASYGATMCAERSAIFALVAAGQRQIRAVAVYAPGEPMAMPCGLCRQVIAELCVDAPVLVAGPRGVLRRSFAALLPEAFRLTREGDP
jgi:cytidine deaminase